MAEPLNFQLIVSGAAGQVISRVVNSSDGLIAAFSVVVPANTANVAINTSFLHGNITSLAFDSDQTVTINTNTWNANGGNTLTINAATPILYYPNCSFSNPITHDVTTAFGNNTGNVNANVTGVVIYH